MKAIACLIAIFTWLMPAWSTANTDQAPVKYVLNVSVIPEQAQLTATSYITLPAPSAKVSFGLHSQLSIETIELPGRLQVLEKVQAHVPVTRYELQFDQPQQAFTIRYQGQIDHPIKQSTEGYGGGRSSTAGLISQDGVFLNIASAWFPVLDMFDLLQFEMKLDLPEGWSGISQGEALEGGRGWKETSPQDDIYLIAGPFTRYQQSTEAALTQVYLRQADPVLADRYLQVTGHYLKLFEKLLGPYPYAKFALVENFWETGYGMPSFTLLGPGVIRLPFILHTSYPHEILHNWWGNGVFVDYDSGNWSEGLTSYLADHLIREQRGQGAAYRRRTLQSYDDYVSEARDFPLSEFSGNHGQASQAVGYGKMLMFLHMLRSRLGDANFVNGLRRFYTDNLFKRANFAALQHAFEEASNQDLTGMFNQWTRRTGAPALKLEHASVSKLGERYRLEFEIAQTQSTEPFQLDLPLFVQLDGVDAPLLRTVRLENKSERFRLELEREPLRINLDPRFETFRQLDPSEIPSSLSQLFGAEQVRLILPRNAEAGKREAYETLAEAWAGQQPGLQVVWDDTLQELPDRYPTWIIGEDNRYADLFAEYTRQEAYSTAGQSIALTLPHPKNPTTTLGFVSADKLSAVAGLARKLPHYGRYSFVTFEGNAPTNRLKGEWPRGDSALSRVLTKRDNLPSMKVPPLKPLTAVD